MESNHAQSAEGVAVVRILAAVLDRLVAANSALAKADPGPITKFHALKAPSISILQYLERIHKYACCSSECFVLALIYIDRMIQGNNFLLTELNVHRVVITGILLAAKFFDDAYYNNAYYAKVGGVLVKEMNSLEVEFLFRINFSLHVSPDVYSKYHAELISHAAGTPAAATLSAALARNIEINYPVPTITEPKHLQQQCKDVMDTAQITPSPKYTPRRQTWMGERQQYDSFYDTSAPTNYQPDAYDPAERQPTVVEDTSQFPYIKHPLTVPINCYGRNTNPSYINLLVANNGVISRCTPHTHPPIMPQTQKRRQSDTLINHSTAFLAGYEYH